MKPKKKVRCASYNIWGRGKFEFGISRAIYFTLELLNSIEFSVRIEGARINSIRLWLILHSRRHKYNILNKLFENFSIQHRLWISIKE